MTGEQLRRRIDRLEITYVEAARRLGLTYDALQKNMRGARPVGRQTALLLQRLEQDRREGRLTNGQKPKR